MADGVRVPFGWARVGIGTAMVVAPRVVGRLWWGEALPQSALAMLRGLGARDAAIGAGTALVGTDAAARGWVRAGIVADAVDCAAAGLSSEMAAPKRAMVLALAGLGLVAGIVLDRTLG